jgi:hypothetical protein
MLEGDLADADGPASAFVDIIGLPFTPPLVQGSPGARHSVPTGMAPQPLRRRRITTRLARTRRPTAPIPTLIGLIERCDYRTECVTGSKLGYREWRR